MLPQGAEGGQALTGRGRVPVPARITSALDLRGLWGDQVDRDLGVWESPTGEWEPGTAVDRWEDGTLTPTVQQVARLALLTRIPVTYFYLQPEEWERKPHVAHLCERGRRGENGHTVIQSWIDDRNVLHVEGLTPPRTPKRERKPPAPEPQPAEADLSKPHRPVEDPDAPGCCRCRRPMTCTTSMHLGSRTR